VAILAAGVAAGLLTALIPATGAAGAVGAAAPSAALCGAGQQIGVHGPWGDYEIKNNVYHPATAPECIRHYRSGPDFAVTRSGANSPNAESDAYPNIFSGCSWGTCTTRSPLPARVFSLKHPWVSWFAKLRAGGKWDANLDIWLSKAPRKSGQLTGAEVMIWMSARGFGHVQTTTTIDGIRWHLEHWTTRSLSDPHVTWPLIIFRAVRARPHVRELALMPFFRHLKSLHLIHSGYWLDSVHAGFEIWRGGVGLHMWWFREATSLQG
jgi:hypothetical protein